MKLDTFSDHEESLHQKMILFMELKELTASMHKY